MIKVDIQGIMQFIPENALSKLDNVAKGAFDALLQGTTHMSTQIL